MKPLLVNPVFNGAYLLFAIALLIIGCMGVYHYTQGSVWLLCLYLMGATGLLIYLLVVYLRYLNKTVLLMADEQGITITKLHRFVPWGDIQDFYLKKDFSGLLSNRSVHWYLHMRLKQGKPCCLDVTNLSLLPNHLWEELDKRLKEYGNENSQ